MAEPTVMEVFGPSSYQDGNYLCISKGDLGAVGLTYDAENRAEALFAAVVAIAELHLTQTNLDTNLDQSIVITDSFPSLTTKNNQTYRQLTKTITFEKIDTQTGFNPDDY